MSTDQLELNVLIEKIRCNDTSLGSELKCYTLLRGHGMTLCSCPRLSLIDRRFVDCSVTENSVVQFIEALKVNTTLTEIDLCSTFKLFHVFRYH